MHMMAHSVLQLVHISGILNWHIESWCPFYKHKLTLIAAWVNNYIHYQVWDEITYPIPKLDGCTTVPLKFGNGISDFWEKISDLISHFSGHVITYPYSVPFY